MVKLFTDEEMAEHCKDYRTIPLGMREDIFNIDGKTSQLKLGFVTPVNIVRCMVLSLASKDTARTSYAFLLINYHSVSHCLASYIFSTRTPISP